MKNFLYGLLLVLAALVGYRIASDYLEDSKDFH